jgi:hypothetical protein
MLVQTLQLGGEQQPAVLQQRVVKRLDAKSIAAQEQALTLPVVNSKGKHAVEVLYAGLPPLLPRGDDHLGVAMGAEYVSARRQLLTDTGEVVDLAVVGYGDIFARIPHRLRTAFEIDNRQAAMAEAHTRFEVQPLTVRAAVGYTPRHTRQQGPVAIATLTQVEHTGDTAHQRAHSV